MAGRTADSVDVVEVSEARFEELVGDALDQVPRPFLKALDNVVITTAEVNDEIPTLLGLYHGVPLTERTHDYTFAAPDEVTLYRGPLSAMCRDEDELAHQIAVTVVHELGHYFGIDDARLHELGWG